MGNFTSCFYIRRANPITAKIMDSNGNLRQVKTPVKAAELMLEEPGHVVSAVHELLTAGRIIGLRAEDDLLAGELYVFVPLSRVNRKISESEMWFIESAIADDKMVRKHKNRGAKVSPSVVVEVMEDPVEFEFEVLEEQLDAGFAGCRLKIYRQWTPALESISEEP